MKSIRGWAAIGTAAIAAATAVAWHLAARTGPGVPPAAQPSRLIGVESRPGSGTPAGSPGAAGPRGSVARRESGAPSPATNSAPGAGAVGSVVDGQGRPGAENELAVMPFPGAPLALVNGVPLTSARIFPPGVAREGDRLPKATYDKFLEEAIDRAVVVQEAERRGFAGSPEFEKLMAELQADINGLPNLSPEERQWQLEALRELTLAERLYREEGILPSRVTPEEVEAGYRLRAGEYEWVRRREAERGSSAERIERRVREEIRRDLQSPIARETQRRRAALAASLRRAANIEIP